MKAALTAMIIIISLSTIQSQTIEIGSSLKYTLMWVNFLAERQGYIYYTRTYDGKTSEVVVEYTDVIAIQFNTRTSIDKRYIIVDNKVEAILEHYYNVSSSRLKANAKSYSLECSIIDSKGKEWFINKDLKRIENIYIDPTSGTATSYIMGINDPTISIHVKKKLDACVKAHLKSKEVEVVVE